MEKMRRICLLLTLFPLIAFGAPRVAIEFPSVDFGEVAANAALVREMRVGNVGDEPLLVSRVYNQPPAPTIRAI